VKHEFVMEAPRAAI